ncbi:protein kinase [Pendulispora rubella]|uniref:Protein kinase n=1 Tax=Pendulispora rubella TaxID=2741070 RepID=A0ABZ2L1C5_9BACT
MSSAKVAILPADALKVGVRILDHLHLEELLDEREGWHLFLADNQALSEFVLLAIAESTDALAACLAGPGQGRVARETTFGSWHIAEVELDEAHLWLFRDKLLRTPRGSMRGTLPSTSGLVERQLEEGSVFNGRYHIERWLGQGGMGEVYRAADGTFQRPVAIKVVRVDASAEGGDHEQAKRRLLNESRMVATLKHPNIVEIYDAGECDGLPYLALELCGDGGNLRSAMKTEASQEERLQWLSQIAEALAYAHEHGIVHRDVKPENVLLTDDKRVKVADFGIAKALRTERLQDDTTFGIVGTPRYMAPEQLLGHRLDARADQYAWGVMAYEVLTGVHPRMRDLASFQKGDSVVTGASLPPYLRRVLQRATANDPCARYPNFRKLLAELHRPPCIVARRWLAAGVAVLAAAGALCSMGARMKGGGPTSTQPPIASAVAQVAAAAPKSEAEGLLEQGIQFWADGSSMRARALFTRAAQLEPNNGRAHLLSLAVSASINPGLQDDASVAFALRGQFAPSEATLLQALNPLVEHPPDVATSTQRIEELASTYPDDPVVRLARAQHYVRSRETHRALNFAASLGNNSTAFWLGARAQLQLGDVAEARSLLEQCIASSPSAMDCLTWLTFLEAADGRCERSEETARKLIAKDSSNPFPYYSLANAVFGRTKSTEAARGILQARLEHTSPSKRPALQATLEFDLHVYDGDFTGADRELGVRQSSTTSSDANFRGMPLIYRVEMELELGRLQEARRAAREFVYRSEAWIPNAFMDTNIDGARLLYLTSQVSRAEFRLVREKFIAKQDERGPHFSSPANRWFDDYVEAVLDATDAKEAIAAMPADHVMDILDRDAYADARLGHVYLLAGRLGEAIPLLNRAVSSCTILMKPLTHVQALLWLGEALDQTGDHGGACKMYTKVVERWGREPRSVTARRARAKLSSCR